MSNDKQLAAKKLLDVMFAKRGYLLPYHRLLAESDPEILETYDNLYTKLTLNERVLTLKEREIVWIALIAITREKYASFHFDRGVTAGMTNEEITDSVAIGGACEAFDTINLAHSSFGKWVSQEAAMKRYGAAFDAARGSLPKAIAEVAGVVCQASRRSAEGMRIHLIRAFESGATREQIAEGLSYVLLHRGGPTMIDASRTWHEVATELGIPGPY